MTECFDWKAALQALRRQCPALADDLAKPSLEGALDAHTVIKLLARKVLQPECTLAIALNFRPVLANLFGTAADDLLSGRLPNVPAAAVLVASAELLTFAPYLERSVLQMLEHHVPPVESLVQLHSVPNPPTEVSSLQIVFAALHLLKAIPRPEHTTLFSGFESLLLHKEVDVRWAAIEAVAFLHNLSESAKERLRENLVGLEAGVQCALKWRDERARMAASTAALWKPTPSHFGSKRRRLNSGDDTDMLSGEPAPLAAPAGFAEVCGVLLPTRTHRLLSENTTSSRGSKHRLVLTHTVEQNLSAAAMALSQNTPLLLEGPPGSGKSAIINELALITGNADYLVIHLDDQMDSKTLLGGYIATARAGEFTWQPGLLTQAVMQGRWLVIEDVNLAPPDVLAALVPLLDARELHLPQRAQTIRAAPGFQLLATVTCSPGGGEMGAYGDSQGVRDMLGGLWSSVTVHPPLPAEQLQILTNSFPLLRPEAIACCMATVHLCKRAGGQASGIFGGKQTAWEATVEDAMTAAGLKTGDLATSFGHHFSLRSLFKLCCRLQEVHSLLPPRGSEADQTSAIPSSVLKLPVATREAAFAECVDCLAGMISKPEAKAQLLSAMSALWAVQASAVERLTSLSKPVLQATETELKVGRAVLSRQPLPKGSAATISQGIYAQGRQPSFAHTASTMRTMEAVAVAAKMQEAVLLVGETGTGKSTLIQHIATQVGVQMVAVNLSQQTDSSDLLGGFRPVQPAEALMPLSGVFRDLLVATWTKGNNEKLLARVIKLTQQRKWPLLLQAFKSALSKVKALDEQQQKAWSAQPHPGRGEAHVAARKRKTSLSEALRRKWREFEAEVATAEDVIVAAKVGVAFAFVEGVLVKALREGSWLLLDEINLAPPEALERIAGLLEGASSSIVLSEKGDSTAVERHPNFRLFAAMNPATDAGKRDLPAQLRQRFTEIYVPEMVAREDLRPLVHAYLRPASPEPPVDDVIDFYLAARAAADTALQDSGGLKPSYSLRTLCRALEYARSATPVYGLQRGLHDGAAMAFLTQLNPSSAPVLEALLQEKLLRLPKPKDLKVLMQRTPQEPPGGRHVLFEHFWVQAGPVPLPDPGTLPGGGRFVITPSVAMHLRNLARAVLLRSYPILLQGPTSSGKTSLVAHLAASTGHRCLRINNHEGTDLQEYLGSYVTDRQGRLAFQEGALVTALRQGHWVILDELNLAPSEVLEALNRLLDDNRELFVPELQEVVKPHPHFMLFATQNPAGAYAGRKTMSRAFRSRFLELHVGDIPDDELATILHERCSIAPSHANKLVAVMKELQRQRQGSNVFAGKHGLITPRDLFKWAARGAVTYQQLAENGFMLLGERLRAAEERAVVQTVLESVMKVKLDVDGMYRREGELPLELVRQQMSQLAAEGGLSQELEARFSAVKGVVWTGGMQRMYTLLDRCLQNSEPALLVGETGTGKTTVCQLGALRRGQQLHIINCNQHTEASDFLGGFRPTRNRQQATQAFEAALVAIQSSVVPKLLGLNALESPDSLAAPELRKVAAAAADLTSEARKKTDEAVDSLQGELKQLEADVARLAEAAAAASAPFEWVDGPLVTAMRRGDMILIDELNLAEDAVLERLNSVLEAGRSLTLAEKGGEGAEEIAAHPSFRLVATMNPGGDYGKRELSPALANRFTTLWVPAFRDMEELAAILASHIQGADVAEVVVPKLLQFWQFFQARAGPAKAVLSVRDLLAWVGFINTAAAAMPPLDAYANGAHLVMLDGIGLGVGMPLEAAKALQDECKVFLRSQLPEGCQAGAQAAAGELQPLKIGFKESQGSGGASLWGVDPFWLAADARPEAGPPSSFEFESRTVARNAMRVLRALQLRKAVLLEGSPGVGKTSLIAALAKATGKELTRINLSEQTDMMDLLGADLPASSGNAGEFAWCDGPLLAALKAGRWVLLDELNLASQSVLEGLNAMLDHRGEIFVAELGETFRAPEGFRVFAAQNPLQEGGGRRGLPKSFLNRFSRVHVDLLLPEDLVFIAEALYPTLGKTLLRRMVSLLDDLHRNINVEHAFGGSGSPWEFNLRDLLRWCQLAASSVTKNPSRSFEAAVSHFSGMLFRQRLRSQDDRAAVAELLQKWGFETLATAKPSSSITADSLEIGWASLARKTTGCKSGARRHDSLQILNGQLPVMESVGHCIGQGWPVLLVGGPGKGKTSIVRSLAALTNQQLVEIALTPGTDTSDILGGFEQFEPRRQLQAVAERLEELVNIAVEGGFGAIGFEGSAPSLEAAVGGLSGVLKAWRSFSEASASAGELNQLELLEVVVRMLEISTRRVGHEDFFLRLKAVESNIRELQLKFASKEQITGRFEWVDGALTKALETGSWVVLENANLCNPTVLDRLNPLLEPDGSLLLNEAGTREGEPRILRAHPNFRLFLAMDARHGAVSRAMRNRCIELCLLPDPVAPKPALAARVEEDLLASLAAEGVPGRKLPEAMAAAHSAVAAFHEEIHSRAPGIRELRSWAALTHTLSQQGWDLEAALSAAWFQIYGMSKSTPDAQRVVLEAFNSHCSQVLAAAPENPIGEPGGRASLYVPCKWPFPPALADWKRDSRLAAIRRDWSLFEGYVVELLVLAGTSRALPLAGLSSEELQRAGGLPEAPTSKLAGENLEAGQQLAWFAAAAFANRASASDRPLRISWTAFAADSSFQHTALKPCRDASLTIIELLQKTSQGFEVRRQAVLFWILAAIRTMTTACEGLTNLHSSPKNASLAQISCWRATNPQQAKMRSKAQHPVIDILYPLLSTTLQLQLQLLQGSEVAVVQQGEGLLRAWELLWECSHRAASPDNIADFLQTFVFRYRRLLQLLKEAKGRPSKSQGSVSWSAAEDAMQMTNAALGWDGNEQPEPLLWLLGGHPRMPATQQLCVLEQKLQTLAALTRFEADRSESCQWPETLAIAGIAEPRQNPEQQGELPEDLGQAVAASLAMHLQLRSHLLQGLSLFRVAARRSLGGDPPDAQKASEIVQLVLERVQQTASEALAAAGPKNPTLTQAAPEMRVLPWQLMTSAVARTLQEEQLQLQEPGERLDRMNCLAAISQAVVRMLAGADLRELQRDLAEALEKLAAASEAGSVQIQAVVQQMKWLLSGLDSFNRTLPEDKRLAIEEKVVELLQSLWTENLAASSPRLPSAPQSTAVAAILGGGTPSVQTWGLKSLHLKLAARHMSRWTTKPGKLAAANSFAAEWSSISSLVSQILMAHKATIPEPDSLADSVTNALTLAERVSMEAPMAASKLVERLRSSNHALLRAQLDTLLKPCLGAMIQAAQLHNQEAVAQEAEREAAAPLGAAWVLLGLLRLQLVAPSAGVDPALEPELERAGILAFKAAKLLPELQVRRELQTLPGGPDESARILALEDSLAAAQEAAEKLEAKLVPRPLPSQFPDLQAEIQRFAGSFCSTARMSSLLQRLQAGDASAAQEARSWQLNAAAFRLRLEQAFPMYLDLTHPVKQAVLEIDRGLGVLISAQDVNPKGFRQLLLQLAAFPPPSGEALDASESRRLGQLAADLASKQLSGDKAKSAAFDARLAALRALLSRSLRSSRSAGEAARGAHPLFGELLTAWEALHEAEAAKAAEEAQVFKTKTKETSFKTEEEEAEEEYNRLFPDHSVSFKEFERVPSEADAWGMSDVAEASPGSVEAGSEGGQSLLRGELLSDLVSLQHRVFDGSSAADSEWKAEFRSGYDLATGLASTASAFSRSSDADLATAHLLRLGLAVVDSGDGSGSVPDVQQPNAAEVVLLEQPVEALRNRLRQLLEEWPENPLLEQLLAICKKVSGLSVTLPLKVAMAGVELLIDRAQLWEQSAAKHVSIAGELSALSALARRWRKIELSAWQLLLSSVREKHAGGAHGSWFHLYRMLLAAPAAGEEPLRSAAATLEQFLQTASLGEFQRRLRMLSTFHSHAEELGPAYAVIAAIIENICSCYSLYLPHVSAALETGLAPVQKHLKDFVKLAKWEDRGHYAQKQATEKAQRQLHKMVQDAQVALSQPAAAVLGSVSAAMGFADVATPDLEEQPGGVGNPKGEGQMSDSPAPWLEQAERLEASWKQSCALIQGRVTEMQGPPPGAADASLYQHRMPHLAERLTAILQAAALGRGVDDRLAEALAGATSLDDLASQAAHHATELRTLSQKGARTRKKKALVDFLHALNAAGISHRRSAVPLEQRQVHAWFSQAPPGAALRRLLEQTQGGYEGGIQLWNKAEAYYFRSVLRLQRLWEAAKQPHADISVQEAERAVRLSEHLLHLQRQQRQALAAAAQLHSELGDLSSLLAGFAPEPARAASQSFASISQVAARQCLDSQEGRLHSLALLFRDSVRLLEVAAEAEPAADLKGVFKAGADSLAQTETRLRAALGTVKQHLRVDFRGKPPLVSPAALVAAQHTHQELAVLCRSLSQQASRFEDACPGWADALSALSKAADEPLQPPQRELQDTETPDLKADLESGISELLLWAQAARANPVEDGAEAGERPVGELMKQLQNQIAAQKLNSLARRLRRLIAALQLTGLSQPICLQLQQLEGLLGICQIALRGLLLQSVCLHKSTAKLGYIATSIFAGLLLEGFCTAEEGEGKEGDGSGQGAFKEAEGTGMGEGEGKKDVSDEIENEDQLLGAKQKGEEEKEEQGEAQPDDGVKGIEMDADFEGALEDIPPNSDSDSEDAAEGDEERLQQQMGEVGDAGETVDEKLWGDDDKPEEEQKAPEKLEKNAPVQVDDKSNLDYQAGQEDGADSAKELQQQEKPKQGEKPEEGASEEAAEEGEPQPEGGEVNEDTEDKYEDRQFAAPQDAEENDLELPEDMEMEGQAGDEEGGAEPETLEEGGAFPEQPTPAEDTPGPQKDGEEQQADAPEAELSDDMEIDSGEAADADVGQETGDPLDPEDEGMQEAEPEPTGIQGMEEPASAEQQPEIGPSGIPSAARASGEEDQDHGKGDRMDAVEGADPPTAALESAMDAATDSQQDQSGAASGYERSAPRPSQARAESGQEDGQKQQTQLENSNPYRSLGDAVEQWRSQLNVTSEMAEADGPGDEGAGEEAEPPTAAEYSFLKEGDKPQQGDTQALAPATEDQAAEAEMRDPDAATDAEQPVVEEPQDEAMAEPGEQLQADQVLEANSQPSTHNLQTSDNQAKLAEPDESQAVDGQEGEPQPEEGVTEQTADVDSFVASLLKKQASLEDADSQEGEEADMQLSEDDTAAIRARMDKALALAADGSLLEGDMEFGRQMWAYCEALTAGLAGELTEQLRLLLEPTRASKLAGDFRTGKRISMRKVVAYVASNFRKDKIWLRRTRPDKRQYQVVIAIDDSRSMRENSCGSFAMEAVTLVARALSRLEVGELSVVRFGGAGSTLPLHPLERPFTDADGPRILSQLRFDQDNTIADRPVVELVTSLTHMLDKSRHRMGGGSLAPPPLHQLVLVVSDGRFHEKESLRRVIADANTGKGTLLAFIALDNPAKSLLDMQSVSFVGGRPVFTRYMDSFPFPYYIVLREIAALPRTLADLLRQWIQLSAAESV